MYNFVSSKEHIATVNVTLITNVFNIGMWFLREILKKHWVQKTDMNFQVAGSKPCGRPCKSWKEMLEHNMRASGFTQASSENGKA